ncbi:hypothetical protein GYMLUDRAFT_683655 [Collybiopsis luxurians FD-317 M1]|uniref:Uncharacterized protein n=1 Tax=Collybiopsis luxurians FD-317 M1 TaxID=944289 RepID=A0A0D0BUI8_9AGAR|nr:hypothetical protein GYMLUDRAFT_683655 [Collybiopsis luxurians FD-317 M1]
MARCSQRIKEKATVYTDIQDVVVSDAADADSDSQDDDQKEDKAEPPRKRARKSNRSDGSFVDDYYVASSSKRQRIPEQFRKVRGKLGHLERLAKDVPLDVILEVSFSVPGLLYHG